MKLTQSSGVIAFPDVLKTEVLSAPTTPIAENIVVHEIEIGNSSGGDAACGWGYKLLDSEWKAGQWDDSEAASYTDDTTDAQDAGTNDFALTTTTNDDGFVVQALEPFNGIGVTMNTAGSSAPVTNVAYWNGSAWTELTPIVAPNYAATGDQYCVFLQPSDWAALASGDTPVATDGLSAGYYAIKINTSTAPDTTAATADKLWAVRLIDYVEKVADGNSAVKEYPAGKIVQAGREIIPFCNTANAANWISFEYRKTP